MTQAQSRSSILKLLLNRVYVKRLQSVIWHTSSREKIEQAKDSCVCCRRSSKHLWAASTRLQREVGSGEHWWLELPEAKADPFKRDNDDLRPCIPYLLPRTSSINFFLEMTKRQNLFTEKSTKIIRRVSVETLLVACTLHLDDRSVMVPGWIAELRKCISKDDKMIKDP